MSGSVFLPRQCSLQDLQQSLGWYEIRDTLLGQNRTRNRPEDIKNALKLVFVNIRMLFGLFGGRDVVFTDEEARQVFLGV